MIDSLNNSYSYSKPEMDFVHAYMNVKCKREQDEIVARFFGILYMLNEPIEMADIFPESVPLDVLFPDESFEPIVIHIPEEKQAGYRRIFDGQFIRELTAHQVMKIAAFSNECFVNCSDKIKREKLFNVLKSYGYFCRSINADIDIDES